MEFLKNKPFLSFKYDGVKADLEKAETDIHNDIGITTVTYIIDSLKVTTVFKNFCGAAEWVNTFENIGDKDTKLISDICDCDISVPFKEDFLPQSRAFVADGVNTLIYSPNGSEWTDYDFCCETEKIGSNNRRFAAIFDGDVKRYSTSGGRSSEKNLPFFDINRENEGVIFAIGWTGQWQCEISRGGGFINIKSGIEETSFVLHPGEKIRTSSAFILPYSDGKTNAHNRLRKIIREVYSPVGKEKRDAECPLSMNFWGGISTTELTDKLNFSKENNLGFEYFWIDAGWYGHSAKDCPNEFEGDWGETVGSWCVNKTYHPDNLEELAKKIKEKGFKFLLWFEPERAMPKSDIFKEHSEYFLTCDGETNLLLDLGREDAWNWCFNMVSEYIKKLGIKFYRQDFNMSPLKYWRNADEENRKGIHEIKHIMGLYRFWDALLGEFPDLLIDNCASGGRRIDIETLRRSVPLWRSDYQCPANHDVDIAQNHTLALSNWIPYHGTSVGRVCTDLYRVRSCYTTALGNNFLYSHSEKTSDYSDEDLDFIRKINAEYKKVREIMKYDFYPLTSETTDKQSWAAIQYDDPQRGKGVLLIFRREKSPYNSAVFELGNIEVDCNYKFTDADDGSSEIFCGKELIESGYKAVIEKKCTAKIYFIDKIK